MQFEAIKNKIFRIADIVLYKISSISFTNYNIILLCNSLVASVSILISIQMRVGIDFFSASYLLLFNSVFVFGLVSYSVFNWFNINNQSLHYNEINKLLLSVLISNFVFAPLLYLMNWNYALPFSIIIINIFVMTVLLLGLKYIYFIFFKTKEYILLIGNRTSISVFLNSYDGMVSECLNNIGIVNTNPEIQIYTKRNIQVIGNIADLNYIISRTNVNQAIITNNNLQDDYKDLLVKLSQQYKFLLVQTCASIIK